MTRLPSKTWAAVAVVLLAGCVHGEETSGRRIEIAHLGGRSTPIVCVESRRFDAPSGWPSPDRAVLGPPPFSLLRDGPFLICRSYQEGAISASDYRKAGLNQLDALLRAQATADLLGVGGRDQETVAELRSWHLDSPFIRVACRAAVSGVEKADTDTQRYCAELAQTSGRFIVMR